MWEVQLRRQEEPGRSKLLFNKAIRMGVSVARGDIEQTAVEEAFFEASDFNGLVAKNGERDVRRTIEKGLRLGGIKAAQDDPVEENVIGLRPAEAGSRRAFRVTPFKARDPADIPRREFLYGRYYIRRFLSAKVAAGGLGKSALALAEAISMAIGQDLLDGGRTIDRLRVSYWNGEDPRDEIERRVAAICRHYGFNESILRDGCFLIAGMRCQFVWVEMSVGRSSSKKKYLQKSAPQSRRTKST